MARTWRRPWRRHGTRLMATGRKQVMDMRTGKGFTRAQSDEHKRNWSDRAWENARRVGNYDRCRDHLNFEVVHGKVVPVDKTRTIPEMIADNLRARGIKDPNHGYKEPRYRTIVNIIFGGSREQMHKLAFGDQAVDLSRGADNSHIKRHADIERWATDIWQFCADRWGADNIAAFVVHLDETNPHIHCTLLPIQDGKFAYKKIFAGRDINEYKQRMRRLHDDLAVVNAPYGLDRGVNVGITGAKHLSTEEYRWELTKRCNNIEETVTRMQGILNNLRNEIAFAERRVKGLSTMIANLEARHGELQQEIESLTAQIAAGNDDTAMLQARLRQLNAEYSRVAASLTDKREKLVAANRKLEEYREVEQESRERIAEYRERESQHRATLQTVSGDLSRQYQLGINEAAVMEMLRELKTILPSSAEARDAFAGSFLGDMAEGGVDVLKCAAMLFAGYVDGAVTFARSCGGGGAATSGWGKKDDEDEYNYRRRCLYQATRMMRPAGGKTIKRK